MMIARYVVGARIKAVRGDRDAAAERLNNGARVAESLRLPRLRAHIENERVRLELPDGVSLRGDRQEALPDGGLGEITAQLRDETDIRGLLADEPALACERAQAWVERLQSARRPRALLQARRLLVAALSAAGRTDEAKETLALVAAQCAERGMLRYLLDGGPHVVALVEGLCDDLRADRRNPSSTGVLAAFLDSVVAAH
jgi:serine/threonine-protein kinase PknK